MVLDAHHLYVDAPGCPLWPWAAVFGFPSWLCWVAARVHVHKRCALLEQGGCPLRRLEGQPCGSSSVARREVATPGSAAEEGVGEKRILTGG
jgi:hypothetical protein